MWWPCQDEISIIVDNGAEVFSRAEGNHVFGIMNTYCTRSISFYLSLHISVILIDFRRHNVSFWRSVGQRIQYRSGCAEGAALSFTLGVSCLGLRSWRLLPCALLKLACACCIWCVQKTGLVYGVLKAVRDRYPYDPCRGQR